MWHVYFISQGLVKEHKQGYKNAGTQHIARQVLGDTRTGNIEDK